MPAWRRGERKPWESSFPELADEIQGAYNSGLIFMPDPISATVPQANGKPIFHRSRESNRYMALVGGFRSPALWVGRWNGENR